MIVKLRRFKRRHTYKWRWIQVRGALERNNIVQARIWAGLPPRDEEQKLPQDVMNWITANAPDWVCRAIIHGER